MRVFSPSQAELRFDEWDGGLFALDNADSLSFAMNWLEIRASKLEVTVDAMTCGDCSNAWVRCCPLS